jgi:hypothetical protein
VIPAIVLHNIIYFVLKNKHEDRNKYDGKHWSYNTYKGWRESMPFLTEHQIRNALRSLRKDKAVVVGNYNKKRYDKTHWYTVADSILQRAEQEEYWRGRTRKNAKATGKSARGATGKSASPIPNNIINIQPY